MKEIKKMNAGNLKVNIYETRSSMGIAAANDVAEKIKELLRKKDEVNMIFAAAPSQNEFLEALVENTDIEWGKINAFHLDEYVNIAEDAPQGFGNFLKARIFGKVNFKCINLLDGNAPDIEAECKRYSELLERYSIDIACIGIGENGHLAFNDPHVSFFDDKTLVKVVELDEKCRQQQVNDGCFATISDVPTKALTLTIPAITQSEFIYCMVPSKTKAQAVYNTLNEEIRERNPASILRLHRNAFMYTEKESAVLIA